MEEERRSLQSQTITSATTDHRAHTVLRHLGSGVGVMSAASSLLEADDWSGLAARVGHVRLCGAVVEPLIDWHTCPGSTRRFDDDTKAVSAIRSSRHFLRFKAAAEAARATGLGLVLNPMSQLYTLDVSASSLRWVWLAMLAEFNSSAWPTERVVFELVNEPGNYNNHTVSASRGRFVDLLPAVLQLIRREQPSRVLIIGGEMGYRADAPRRGEFINSGPALILDAPAIAAARRYHPHLIGTFHFYRPRAFTNQGFPEVSVPQPRWEGTAADVADLATQFDDVHAAAAANGSLPVYLGEFGVNVDFVPYAPDAAAWMRTVRQLAESRGFGWALWTYYLSPKALTTEGSAAMRLRQWDCSQVRAAAVGAPAESTSHGASCPPRNRSAPVDAEAFAQTRSFHGGGGACNDRRPRYLQARLRGQHRAG